MTTIVTRSRGGVVSAAAGDGRNSMRQNAVQNNIYLPML